jgi:RNA polymerase sigma-70 factor (ECF subfamily)
MQHSAGKEFSALIEREQPRLRGFVLALVGDPERAEDLCQATCLELWRIRATFRPGSDFGAWARTVARYQVLRYWKRAKIERRIFSREAVDALERSYADAEPARRVEDRDASDMESDERGALAACLETLSEDCRDLLKERYTEAVPVREMARRRGTSEPALKMRLVRLRKKLAECVRARLRVTSIQ